MCEIINRDRSICIYITNGPRSVVFSGGVGRRNAGNGEDFATGYGSIFMHRQQRHTTYGQQADQSVGRL